MTQIEWSTRSTSAFNVFFVLFVRIYYLYMYILLCNKLEICSVAIGNWVAPVSDDISCIIEQQRIARWKNVWEYFLRVVNVICCMLGKNIRAQLYLKRIVTMANWWIWRESDALSKASVVRSATICSLLWQWICNFWSSINYRRMSVDSAEPFILTNQLLIEVSYLFQCAARVVHQSCGCKMESRSRPAWIQKWKGENDRTTYTGRNSRFNELFSYVDCYSQAPVEIHWHNNTGTYMLAIVSNSNIRSNH